MLSNKALAILIFALFIPTPGKSSALSEHVDDDSKTAPTMACFAGDDFNPDHLRDSMLKDARTNESPGTRFTTISVDLKRGQIDNPKIIEGSGNAQFDFDCLQAVLGIDCATHSISGSLKETFSLGDFSQSKTAFKKPRGTLSFYIIPVNIFDRFGMSSVLTKEDIFGAENIATISNHSQSKVSKEAIENLRQIYCDEWGAMVKESAAVTRRDLLSKRQAIANRLARI